MSSESETRDVLILGGGLVGMALAIGLARAGATVHVVDRDDPATQTAEGFDGRASAISTASWNLFTHLGLAPLLEPKGSPIEAIAVNDALRPGQLDFRPEPGDDRAVAIVPPGDRDPGVLAGRRLAPLRADQQPRLEHGAVAQRRRDAVRPALARYDGGRGVPGDVGFARRGLEQREA